MDPRDGTAGISTAEELRQALESATDYLVEQLEENPANVDAWQFYNKQVYDAQQAYLKSASLDWFAQLANIAPVGWTEVAKITEAVITQEGVGKLTRRFTTG